MNNQDKILLSAYIDNELNQEELIYIESLLEKDAEAFSYLNKIKEINNQTESFFNEALQSDEFKNFQSFVEELQPKERFYFQFLKNNSYWPQALAIRNFFMPQAIAGYALSGLLFFNLGTNTVAGFQDVSSQVASSDFQKDILVFRSEESENFLYQVKNVAIDLINEGDQKAKGSYGDKSYTLKVTKEASINEESKCFLAEFESMDEQKLFSICKSGENSSILEVTQ
jgi:hypothetical protein